MASIMATAPAAPSRARSLPDVVLAALLALAAAAATALPPGSTLRIALAMPVLFLVPGYLLMQALVVPAAPWRQRGIHLLMGLGLSPVVTALAALATSFVSGAFRPGVLVAVVTLVSLLLAGVATFRRLRPQNAAAPLPDPATAAWMKAQPAEE